MCGLMNRKGMVCSECMVMDLFSLHKNSDALIVQMLGTVHHEFYQILLLELVPVIVFYLIVLIF